MKKQKYNLDIQEQEIGDIIDSTTENKPTLLEPVHTSDNHEETEKSQDEKEKLIMKNIWVPESVDCQVKLIRAVRQRQRLPNKFNDIANEALVEYIQRHLNEELQSSSD